MLCAYGGKGYAYLLTDFLPRLLDYGFNQNDITQIMVSNSANALKILSK